MKFWSIASNFHSKKGPSHLLLCDMGPRQRLEPIYLRAGGQTGVLIWKQIQANLKQIMRLTAHGGWGAS